jgi:hypothetical protein
MFIAFVQIYFTLPMKKVIAVFVIHGEAISSILGKFHCRRQESSAFIDED